MCDYINHCLARKLGPGLLEEMMSNKLYNKARPSLDEEIYNKGYRDGYDAGYTQAKIDFEVAFNEAKKNFVRPESV